MNRYFEVPFHKDSVEESGKFTGYGSVFGGKADSYGDIIAHGAFGKSVLSGGRNGTGVAMLWQHNSDQPIGVWEEIYEDNKGLKMTGQLAIETQMGHDAYILMKMGALKGLSIGWDLPRDSKGKPTKESFELDEKSRTRTLKMIDLWEVSPVTFPAQTRARITGVKSIEEAQDERELECALRDLGLSKTQAVWISNMCKPSLRESMMADEEDVMGIMASLKDAVERESQRSELYEILNSLNSANQAMRG
jgi:uncharacterized protein